MCSSDLREAEWLRSGITNVLRMPLQKLTEAQAPEELLTKLRLVQAMGRRAADAIERWGYEVRDASC